MKTPCASTPGRQRHFLDPQKGRALFSRRFLKKIFLGNSENSNRNATIYFLSRNKKDPAPSESPIFCFGRLCRIRPVFKMRARLAGIGPFPSRKPALDFLLCVIFFISRARARAHFCETQIAQPAPLPKPFQRILVSLERSEPDLSNDAGIWRNGFSSGAG